MSILPDDNGLPIKKKPSVNMRMIAAKAGVSATTVSLALRGDSTISPETRDRIYKIQEAMGYRQDRNRRTSAPDSNRLEKVVCWLAGLDFRDETYAPFFHGIIEECTRRSLKLELQTPLESSASTAVPGGRALAPKKGLILSGRLTEKDIAAAKSSGLPFIVLGNYRLGGLTNVVAIDLMEASERMIEDLHREGVRSVTIVLEEAKRPFEREMLRCLRGVLLDFGIPAGDDIIVETGAGFSDLQRAAKQVLQREKKGSCVITVEYRCANHLLMELRAQSGDLANGINLVSFAPSIPKDMNSRCRLFNMAIEKCGEFAVSRLADILANPQSPACQCLLTAPGWSADGETPSTGSTEQRPKDIPEKNRR